MLENQTGRLTTLIILILFTSVANAENYFCEDTAGISLDQYGISTSAEEVHELEQKGWIVDTDKGWRRSDFPDFNGNCESNKGYVVCKAQDIVFGEATFSIHPDGSNFILVYIDYGLNALAFVGKCKQA